MLNQKSFVLVSFINFVISAILYVFAPNYYSFIYCLTVLVFYIFSSLILISNTKINGNYFNFHLILTVSLFFVNFVYPVFLYPINPEYFKVYEIFEFDHNVITKATALVLVGWNSYSLGVSSIRVNKKKSSDIGNLSLEFEKIILMIAFFFLSLMFFFFASKEIIKGNFGATSKIPPGLIVLYQTITTLLFVLVFLNKIYRGKIGKFLLKVDKKIYIVFVFSCFIFLRSGDRGPILMSGLVLIGLFSFFVKRITFKQIVLLLLFGMFFMSIIQAGRTRSVEQTQGGIVERGIQNFKLNSFFDIGMDLIVNNRNLYVGYSYAKKNGFLYGSNFYYQFLAPFPYLPSLFTRTIYKSNPKELTTAVIITKESGAKTFGLGTNMIIDMYMSFGSIGVIIIMMLFGWFVRTTEINGIVYKKIYYAIIYFFLVGFSVLFPRTTVIEPIRHIGWALILFGLIGICKYLLSRDSKVEIRNEEE